MSLDLDRRRRPRQLADELAMDRPLRSTEIASDDRAERYVVEDAGARYPSDRRELDRPIVIRTPPARQLGPLDLVSRGIGLLAKLTLLLILLAVLWGVVTLVGVGARAPGALGEQVGAAIERGASVAAAIGQRIADRFDPAHPPRSPLAQDVEIDALMRLDVGAQVPGTTERVVTVASVQRRPGAESPDTAVHAVIHSELKTPRETKILGMTVSSSRDPRDDYLYKGETIRIGRTLYKVNWISVERQQVALIAYRDQDRVTANLKAELD